MVPVAYIVGKQGLVTAMVIRVDVVLSCFDNSRHRDAPDLKV